jgi:hypothetical protein
MKWTYLIEKKYHLINLNGIDNVKYFRNLAKKLDHTTEHLFFGDDDGPLQASHYWLTGVKP